MTLSTPLRSYGLSILSLLPRHDSHTLRQTRLRLGIKALLWPQAAGRQFMEIFFLVQSHASRLLFLPRNESGNRESEEKELED